MNRCRFRYWYELHVAMFDLVYPCGVLRRHVMSQRHVMRRNKTDEPRLSRTRVRVHLAPPCIPKHLNKTNRRKHMRTSCVVSSVLLHSTAFCLHWFFRSASSGYCSRSFFWGARNAHSRTKEMDGVQVFEDFRRRVGRRDRVVGVGVANSKQIA